jgi:hypothetical protein
LGDHWYNNGGADGAPAVKYRFSPLRLAVPGLPARLTAVTGAAVPVVMLIVVIWMCRSRPTTRTWWRRPSPSSARARRPRPAREATQVHGGYGFMNEFPVGRFYRDAKILEIGESTSEVQRMITARDLGMWP